MRKYCTESELHKRFAEKRIKGEWFNLSAADLRTITRLLPREEKR